MNRVPAPRRRIAEVVRLAENIECLQRRAALIEAGTPAYADVLPGFRHPTAAELRTDAATAAASAYRLARRHYA